MCWSSHGTFLNNDFTIPLLYVSVCACVGRWQDLEELTMVLQEEKRDLLAKKAASEERNSLLEGNIRVLTQRGLERENDLER